MSKSNPFIALIVAGAAFVSTLAFICGLIAVTSEAAQAKPRRPLADTGNCSCTCNSNAKNEKGKSKWSADGPAGKGITAGACNAKTAGSCVVMSPFGLKPGTYTGCLWSLSSQ